MQSIDAPLISRCIQREERALYELYRHCYPVLRGIAMRYVFDRDRVGEVVNTGFLKIVNGLSKYDERQMFKPWISTIMIRVSIDYVRQHMRSISSKTDLKEDMTLINGTPITRNLADLQFDAEELLDMLNDLPEQTRIVFNLYAIDGYSHKEVGERLGISDGTSKWHVSRARQLLQAQIILHTNKKRSDYEPSY